MEKITLNEYLKQGSVVENLKKFVGVTPENTVGLMTPERLAAVAGGLKNFGLIRNTNADDLKNPGIYHLGDGCTPLYAFLIVFKIGDSLLQFSTADGGSGLSTRAFGNGQWYNWCRYAQR